MRQCALCTEKITDKDSYVHLKVWRDVPKESVAVEIHYRCWERQGKLDLFTFDLDWLKKRGVVIKS